MALSVRKSLLCVGLAGLLVGCAGLVSQPEITVGPATSGQDITTPSERRVGQRSHPQILAKYGGVYENKSIEALVTRVLGRLVPASDEPARGYRVTILNSPTVNAFAVTGGYLYVTRGLVALANDEAELAAVLSHEIAHVTARHGIARARKQESVALAAKVAAQVVGNPELAQVTLASTKVSLAQFSQIQELEADLIGIRTSGNARYDPYAASRFLTSLSRFSSFRETRRDGGQSADFLSSHPSTPDRIERARRAARQFGGPEFGERGQEAYLDAIDGIMFGDDPSEGFVRGRSFIHTKLGISFTVPRGYILENTRRALLARNGAGTAIKFDSVSGSRSAPLSGYLEKNDIKGLVPASIREYTVNGNDAASASAINGDWSFRIGLVRIGRTIYRFVFATQRPNNAFDRDFRDTIDTFRELSKREIDQYRPLKLEVRKVREGEDQATYGRLMAGVESADQLVFFRIMNGLTSKDVLKPGDLVKVVSE
ncbi:MAG: M48 family metalloprotease [Pseudomonadota bacterium]